MPNVPFPKLASTAPVTDDEIDLNDSYEKAMNSFGSFDVIIAEILRKLIKNSCVVSLF